MVTLKRVMGFIRTEPHKSFNIVADFTLDPTTSTVTIDTQASDKFDGDAYARIPGATTAGFQNGLAVVGDNEIEYQLGISVAIELTAHIEASTGASEVLSCAWFRNDNIIDATATRFRVRSLGGGLAGTVVSTGVSEEVTRGDTFGVRVANIGSTNDITVGEVNAMAANL